MTAGTRRTLAIASLAIALLAQIGLPGLHALVHRLEARGARTTPVLRRGPGWRVEARTPQRASRPAHEHAPGERHHDHQHPGDAPGQHGAGAPEHLAAALVATAPALVPVRLELELPTAPARALVDLRDARLPSTDRNRGPPPTA